MGENDARLESYLALACEDDMVLPGNLTLESGFAPMGPSASW